MFKNIPSIVKKQIVGISGVCLIGFIFVHLSGNLLIFKGAKEFNAYSHFLHELGSLLWVMRIGLLVALILHLTFVAIIVVENVRARKHSYKKYESHLEQKSILARSMPITGSLILLFVGLHLADFTFNIFEQTSLIRGVDMGLYGIVVNSFKNPIHSLGYIAAMIALGMHLGHSFQSVCQTFGLNNAKTRERLNYISLAIGIIIGLTYSSIPIYVISYL